MIPNHRMRHVFYVSGGAVILLNNTSSDQFQMMLVWFLTADKYGESSSCKNEKMNNKFCLIEKNMFDSVLQLTV